MEKRVQLNLSLGEFLYIKGCVMFLSGVAGQNDIQTGSGFNAANQLGPFHHMSTSDKLNATMHALAPTDEEILACAPGIGE